MRYLGVALVVALSVVTPAAAAEEPPSPARPAAAKGTGDAKAAGEEKASGEVRWDPEWTQAGAGHVAVVAAAGAVALAGQFIAPDRTKVWSQRYDVDEDVRQGLRLPTSAGRATAKTASDFLAALVVVQPSVGDAWLNAWWGRGNRKVAWELTVINAEVLAVTAALVGTSKWYFSRERPFGQGCGVELDADSGECLSRDRYLSFFSGHAQFTFASASLTCVNHHYLPLWGDTPPWVACVTGYTLAATTGALRIAADRHYFTDVVTGAMVGTLVGVTIPLLHYMTDVPTSRFADGSVSMFLGVSGDGLTLSGAF